MNSDIFHLLAADFLLFIHLLFVIFLVLGLILILLGKLFIWHWVRNPWFRLTHLLGIGFVILQSWLGKICPLTIWEMTLREKAGDTVYAGTFISYWMENILYYRAPAWVFVVCYTAFGILVLCSWFWVRPDPFSEDKKE